MIQCWLVRLRMKMAEQQHIGCSICGGKCVGAR